MVWQDTAFIVAGGIGAFTAIAHGVVTQRVMVAPVDALLAQQGKGAGVIRRLVPALLQFSTYNWLLGGLALVAAALWAGRDVQLAVALLVGSSYLFGAVGNFWSTRGRHPGWMLMTAALILIVLGVGVSGA